MSLRLIQLPTRLVKDLRKVSRLSTKQKWEYGGRLLFDDTHTYTGFTQVTSKERARIDSSVLEPEWYSNSTFTYHTHPGIFSRPNMGCEKWSIFATLPSNSDLEAYVKGYPEMKINFICDAHGYYIIDVLKAQEMNTCALPISITSEMKTIRYEDFLYERGFGEDRCEYFLTTLPHWKMFINQELYPRMMNLYGISIHYYGYEDEPPMVIIDA